MATEGESSKVTRRYLLLCGGRAVPSPLVFSTEEQARAEFGRLARAGRAHTQWMELAAVGGDGRLQRLDRYRRAT